MRIKNNVLLISVIAATGGLLFGFDTGVISGALPFLRQYWKLPDSSIEWITTTVLIGAVAGAVSSGRLSDLLGRKKMIIINAVIFSIGAIGCAYAPTPGVLIVTRLLIGVAIGITSYVVPMYIAEISPASYRGALVTLNQLMITIGILVSYITDYWLSNDAKVESWRWMFLVGLVPALILLVGMLFLPESPRWQASRGQVKEEKEWREVFKPWLRAPLIITVGIFFFQQFSGVNTIIYYSPIIFKMAGVVSNTDSILPAIIIGGVNTLACFVSILLLDRVGRRKLYMIGISGMIPSLALLGACFHFKAQLGASLPVFAVVSIVLYIISIAISLAPLGWLLISEIFPLPVKGVGMSIGSLAHWGFNAIIAFTFLKLVNAFGPDFTFWLYAVICVAGLFWGYFYIPETKGRSLEEIEQHWKEGKSPKNL
jgi:MFS family permease